ncbi:MAG: hypothetical protein HYV09_03405 [Deltaproteobacteria bacterium]|nr:hypothetical protein [Deltaproteobacteria bacterium]
MPNEIETALQERAEGTAAPEAPPPVRKTIEAWESEKGVPTWLRAATRALHRFPRGRELLEQEFDDAVRAAADLSFR